MQIKCQKCGQVYEVDSSIVGKTAECEICQNRWVVVDDSTATVPCPMCGEKILSIAKKCRFCGEYLNVDKAISRKDHVVYVLLGILGGWVGLHNFYAHQFSAAAVKLIITVGGIVAVGQCSPAEALRVWLIPLVWGYYFTAWDLCYDPNILTKDRKKIFGISPWLMSIVAALIVVFFIGFIVDALSH